MRVQSMNGVDLDLFRFEYDLTWMAFFMDADDRFYSRYGGREDQDAESHLTQKSLARTMRQVLDLHAGKAVLKKPDDPVAVKFRTPEHIPPMKPMIDRRKNSKCIHCHDVKVAALRHEQSLGRFKLGMIFSYPTPRRIGIDIDPDRQNVVRGVDADSPAARAGVRAGDVILSAGGQRILTFGDFSRVLELTPDSGPLSLAVERASEERELTLDLESGWRRNQDPSWRPTTHVAGPGGGFWGRKLDGESRRKLGLGEEDLALKVNTVWAPHAKEAGIKNGDVVVSIDGRKRDMTIRQLHTYLQLEKSFGDIVPLTVRRGDRSLTLTLKLPENSP